MYSRHLHPFVPHHSGFTIHFCFFWDQTLWVNTEALTKWIPHMLKILLSACSFRLAPPHQEKEQQAEKGLGTLSEDCWESEKGWWLHMARMMWRRGGKGVGWQRARGSRCCCCPPAASSITRCFICGSWTVLERHSTEWQVSSLCFAWMRAGFLFFFFSFHGNSWMF